MLTGALEAVSDIQVWGVFGEKLLRDGCEGFRVVVSHVVLALAIDV